MSQLLVRDLLEESLEGDADDSTCTAGHKKNSEGGACQKEAVCQVFFAVACGCRYEYCTEHRDWLLATEERHANGGNWRCAGCMGLIGRVLNVVPLR